MAGRSTRSLGVMKRTSIAILCVVALLVGAAVGAYVGFDYASSLMGRMVNTTAAANSAAGIDAYVRTLESMRNSNGDAAIGVLEARLDNDLVTLGSLPSEYLPSSAPEVVRRAAAYRTKYPRKASSAEVEAAIQRTFAIGK